MKKEFFAGPLRISPNLILSPMSGVTDNPFRQLIWELSQGRVGIFMTEFISSEGLVRKNPKALRQMRHETEQSPFGVQIFGGNPERMADAAKMVEQAGAQLVEINCGCPAPKVVRKSGGSALLKDLSRYAEIIRAIVGAVKIPVSVKVRTGFSDAEINALESGKIAQEEGASQFIIHGRTREQEYKGRANWDIITAVKGSLAIPVIGNGDIVRWQDVIQRINDYGVDGVSVGRGALHNPWIFAQLADHYQGKIPMVPSPEAYIQVFRRYGELLAREIQYHGAVLGRLKMLASRLVKGFPGSAEARTKLLRSEEVELFLKYVQDFFEARDEREKVDDEYLLDLNGSQPSESNGPFMALP